VLNTIYEEDFLEHETDARRFWDAMRDRLQEFSLSLHPKKTRLIEFGRHAANDRKQRGLGKPETFNFIGMSFICSKSRGGKFLLKRKTRRDRMQKVPRNWADLCDSVTDNFRVINPKEFRVMR
jgi:hypothetical protein